MRINNDRNWKQLVRDSIHSPEALQKLLHSSQTAFATIPTQFPMLVPQQFARLIEADNPFDPLLLQVLPQTHENTSAPGETRDPVGDLNAEVVPGLLHKYKGRALLILTGACAIHCRYCFRQHFPYSDSHLSESNWEKIKDYLILHEEIEEIILSGGDPLMLTNSKLRIWLQRLNTLKHIKRLRIHTRIPTVLPERIDAEFIQILQELQFQNIVVTHVNHPKELTTSSQNTLNLLNKANILLFNQSVLLKGVNDNVHVLKELSLKLFETRTMPYYLHLLDPVQGTAHFKVSLPRAKKLLNELQAELPGYLVPKLVQELPGNNAKTLITC